MKTADSEQIIGLPQKAAVRKAVRDAWEAGLEKRDANNIPVGCPLDRVEMLHYAMERLGEDTFDPCTDCAFLVRARLDSNGLTPTRDDDEWFDHGFCGIRSRGLVMVSTRAVNAHARKVVPDDADNTDEKVLDCIDRGLTSVYKIVDRTGMAERTVFKSLARLRALGLVAYGAPLRRASLSIGKVAANG